MRLNLKLMSLAVVCTSMCSPALRADFITISQPTASYLSSTALIDFTNADNTLVGAMAGPGGQLLTYDNYLDELTVPPSWTSWGRPPAVESATPRVGYTDGADVLTIDLSKPVSTFGFEAQPNNFGREEMTAAFYSGVNLIGVIDLFPNGNNGALLFAASSNSNPFTSVVISNAEGDDFAIARQRYAIATPEPATLGGVGAVLGLGMALALGRQLRKRRLAA